MDLSPRERIRVVEPNPRDEQVKEHNAKVGTKAEPSMRVMRVYVVILAANAVASVFVYSDNEQWNYVNSTIQFGSWCLAVFGIVMVWAASGSDELERMHRSETGSADGVSPGGSMDVGGVERSDSITLGSDSEPRPPGALPL